MTKVEEFLKSFGIIKDLRIGQFNLDVEYDVHTNKPKVSLWANDERVETSSTDEFGVLELITSAIEDESYFIKDYGVNITEIGIWDDIDEDDGSITIVFENLFQQSSERTSVSTLVLEIMNHILELWP